MTNMDEIDMSNFEKKEVIRNKLECIFSNLNIEFKKCEVENIDLIYTCYFDAKRFTDNQLFSKIGTIQIFFAINLIEENIVIMCLNIFTCNNKNRTKMLEIINTVNQISLTGNMYIKDNEVKYYVSYKVKHLIDQLDECDIKEYFSSVLQAINTFVQEKEKENVISGKKNGKR